jgi:hypothetical protein
MKTKRSISSQQATAAWQDVFSRGMQMFAYFHWWQLQVGHPSFKVDANCNTIKNAALESSLMSTRDLDDFFLSKPKQPDDLVASDYGFSTGQNFLTQSERQTINKKLAHLTYQSTLELQKDPMRKNPRTWNYAAIINRAGRALVSFLKHLASVFLVGSDPQVELAKDCIALVQQTLKNINAIAKSEMDFTA